jgi:N-acetylmuramic acid 6-phosphate etherase
MRGVILAVDLSKTSCRAAAGGRRAEGAGAPGLAAPGGMRAAEAAILAVARELGPVDEVIVGAAGALAAPNTARALGDALDGALRLGAIHEPHVIRVQASTALHGPEVLAGSTRLTAGTAQKVVLNALSTSVTIALGKAYGPRMVDMRATNAKLRRRAVRIVRDAAGVDEQAATAALAAAGGHAKTAIVALLAGVDAAEAALRLERARGHVRDALGWT